MSFFFFFFFNFLWKLLFSNQLTFVSFVVVCLGFIISSCFALVLFWLRSVLFLRVFFSPHAGSNLYGERFRTSRIGIILQHNSLTHSHVAITVSTTTYTSTHSYLNWRHLLYSWFCLESSYYFHLFIHISLNFSLTSPVCLTNEVLWVWPLTDWLTDLDVKVYD